MSIVINNLDLDNELPMERALGVDCIESDSFKFQILWRKVKRSGEAVIS